MGPKTMPREKVSFETALHELERVIEQLESEELTLDSALEHFEKGISLMRSCDSHLKNAEGKLKELLKGENGEFIERVLGISMDTLSGE